MNDAKHTPGPWTVDETFHPGSSGPSLWADGMLLARITGHAQFDHENARLMAAAPDLLAACLAAFAMLADRGNPFAGDDWQLGHRLSAAIGLATDPDYPREGRSPMAGPPRPGGRMASDG